MTISLRVVKWSLAGMETLGIFNVRQPPNGFPPRHLQTFAEASFEVGT